jgi:hypothetical protein
MNNQKSDSSRIPLLLQQGDFSFREGFPERTTARLENFLSSRPLRSFYASLSSLFPKVLYGSLIAISLTFLIIFLTTGEFSVDSFIGKEKVDDSNFISYLIYENFKK